MSKVSNIGTSCNQDVFEPIQKLVDTDHKLQQSNKTRQKIVTKETVLVKHKSTFRSDILDITLNASKKTKLEQVPKLKLLRGLIEGLRIFPIKAITKLGTELLLLKHKLC